MIRFREKPDMLFTVEVIEIFENAFRRISLTATSTS